MMGSTSLPIKEEREKLQDELNEYAIRLNQLWGKTGKTINQIVWSEQRTRETVAGYKAPDSVGLLEERSANNMTLINLDERLSKLRIVEEAYCLISRKLRWSPKFGQVVKSGFCS